jgi:hypothetical protein
MPERWETQIRKLRGLEPPEGLRARVSEGPHGEPPPPPRRRVAAAVTAFVLFAAAAALVVRTLAPADAPDTTDEGVPAETLTLELLASDGAPTAMLRYGDQGQPGVREGYKWCSGGDCVAGIADFNTYPPVWEYIVVPPGTPIGSSGDGMLSALHVTDLDGERIPGADASSVPDADGVYALEAEATWPDGEANFFFGVQVLSSPAAAPDVLHVDCSYGRPTLDTAVVRTEPDGLHVAFSGTEGYAGFEIVTPEGTSPEEFFGVGGNFPDHEGASWPIDPGRWELGCFERGETVRAGDTTTPFELVDPDDHHASLELPCSDPLEQESRSEIPTSVPPAQAAAQLVTGLGGDDRLRDGGYDAEDFKLGPTYVVERAGQTIARLVLGAPADTWSATFWTCEGSGIVLSGTASAAPTGTTAAIGATGATELIPDVLVVRCEGARPVLEYDVVRLQADGLHVETTTSDAEAAHLVAEDGSTETFVAAGSEPDTFVVSVPPGKAWVIACLPPDGQGQIDTAPDDLPASYAQVTLLPGG